MSITLKIVILLLLTLIYTILSWRSLGSLKKHGLYRLISWIAASSLILLNIEFWFYEPFSINQIISWLLLIFSIIILIYGVVSLRQGISSNSREDDTLFGIEKTTKLVTTKAYRYIRHPIYSSILFGSWGLFFKHISWIGFVLVMITSLFVYLTAKKEESENLEYFGDDYYKYCQNTKRLIPFIF